MHNHIIKSPFPPLTPITYPVIQLLSLCNKNAAMLAISSGSPTLCKGCPLAIFSFSEALFKRGAAILL